MVFHDSRDWGCDIQMIADILRARDGVFGTIDDNVGKPGFKQIPLYFSHNDLLWGNDFPVVRFGQGAFRAALENVWLVSLLLRAKRRLCSDVPRRFCSKPRASRSNLPPLASRACSRTSSLMACCRSG